VNGETDLYLNSAAHFTSRWGMEVKLRLWSGQHSCIVLTGATSCFDGYDAVYFFCPKNKYSTKTYAASQPRRLLILTDIVVETSNLLSRDSDWLRAGRPRGRSSCPGRVKNFLFCTLSRPALGSTQPPIQWVPGALSREVKRPGREADHSPPTSAERLRKCGSIHTLPHTPSWRSA
jgi:hypothetical protein